MMFMHKDEDPPISYTLFLKKISLAYDKSPPAKKKVRKGKQSMDHQRV